MDKAEKCIEKCISPEKENELLRRKIQKLEGELDQLMNFTNELQNKDASQKKEIARLAAVSMYSEICPNVYNKRFFDQETPRMIAVERRFCRSNGFCYGVVYADLNHLKQINTRHGHAGGDKAICAVANKMLNTSVRHSDIVAHLHGDEIVVLFFASNVIEGYKSYARIRRAVRKVEVVFDDGKVEYVSAMTALALQQINDSISLPEACHKADMRMLEKKEKRDKKELQSKIV